MSALRNGNSDYQAVKVIAVDWDRYANDPIARELNVRRRSTLVMFSGGKEVGRVVAQTARKAIEALFRAAI